MAITKDLLVQIRADTAGAVKGVTQVSDALDELNAQGKTTGTAVEGIEGALSGFGAQAIAGNAAVQLLSAGFAAASAAAAAIVEPINKALDAFTAYRTGVEQLGFSLAAAGDYSDKSIASFKALADEMGRLGAATEQQTFQLVTLAKNFGVTDDVAKQLVRTAADIAAASNGTKTLTGAFDSLMQVMRGMGRGAAELDKGLLGLNRTALQSKGLDILTAKYSGFSQMLSTTYAGTLSRTAVVTNDIFKQIGKSIDNFFDRTGAAGAKLAFLQSLDDQIHDIQPKVDRFFTAIRIDIEAFAKAFAAIDFKHLGEEIIPVLGGIAGGFAAIAAVKLLPTVINLTAMGVAAAATAAQVLLISGAVTAVVAAFDILFKNFSHLEDVGQVVFSPFVLAFKNLELVIRGLDLSFTDFLDGLAKKISVVAPSLGAAISSGLEAAKSATEKRMLATTNEIADLADKTAAAYKKIDGGFAGAILTAGKQAVAGMKTAQAELSKQQENAAPTNKPKGPNINPISEENKSLLDEAISKGNDAFKEMQQRGLDQIGIIKAQANEQQSLNQLIFEQLKAENQLTPIMEQNLKIAASRISSNEAAKIAEEQQKNYAQLRAADDATYKQITDHIAELNREYVGLAGTQQEGIKQVLSDRLDALDAEKDAIDDQISNLKNQLNYNQDLTEELKAQYAIELKKLELAGDQADKAKDLAKRNAEEAARHAPSAEFEGAAKAGQQIAHDMTEGATGLLGAAQGAVVGVSAVIGAAQAMVDAIPNLLGQISHLIESFTALPMAIADGVQKVFTDLLKFVGTFPQLLISATSKILNSAVTFLQNLPQVFNQMMKQLPAIIEQFIQQLPDVVQKLVRAFEDAGPEIAESFVQVMIAKGPEIGLKIAEAMIVTVPVAIAKGIIQALMDLPAIISGSFKGLGSAVASGLAQGVASVGKTLTTASSKLFEVIDASATAKGVDTATALSNAIESASNQAAKVLGAAWGALKSLWNGIKAAVLDPFIAQATAMWNAAKAILTTAASYIEAGWQWAVDHVLTPIASVVQGAWQFVVDRVLTPLSSIVQAAWAPVSSMLSAFGKAVSTLTGSFKSLDGFAGAVSTLLGGFKSIDNFSGAVSVLAGQGMPTLSTFSGAVNRLTQAFSSLDNFSGAVSKLSTLSLSSVSSGSTTSASGASSVVQKVTSYFAQGGMVPHYAAAGLMIPRGNDTVPVMTEPGEFILRRRAVQSLGASNVAAMNATGKAPQGNTTVNLGGVTIHATNAKLDDSYIRQTLVPAIQKEIKKASVDGRFVLSSKGLRNV